MKFAVKSILLLQLCSSALGANFVKEKFESSLMTNCSSVLQDETNLERRAFVAFLLQRRASVQKMIIGIEQDPQLSQYNIPMWMICPHAAQALQFQYPTITDPELLFPVQIEPGVFQPLFMQYLNDLKDIISLKCFLAAKQVSSDSESAFWTDLREIAAAEGIELQEVEGAPEIDVTDSEFYQHELACIDTLLGILNVEVSSEADLSVWPKVLYGQMRLVLVSQSPDGSNPVLVPALIYIVL